MSCIQISPLMTVTYSVPFLGCLQSLVIELHDVGQICTSDGFSQLQYDFDVDEFEYFYIISLLLPNNAIACHCIKADSEVYRHPYMQCFKGLAATDLCDLAGFTYRNKAMALRHRIYQQPVLCGELVLTTSTTSSANQTAIDIIGSHLILRIRSELNRCFHKLGELHHIVVIS